MSRTVEQIIAEKIGESDEGVRLAKMLPMNMNINLCIEIAIEFAKENLDEFNTKWNEIYKAQNDYINVLGMSMDDAWPTLQSVGYKPQRVEEGKRAYNKLMELRDKYLKITK